MINSISAIVAYMVIPGGRKGGENAELGGCGGRQRTVAVEEEDLEKKTESVN